MRQPAALPVVVLMILLPIGCGRAPSPPVSPGPTGGNAAPAAPAVDDPAAILKAVQEAAGQGGGASGGGMNRGTSTVQVGSHRLTTIADAAVSSVMQNESALVNFRGQTLLVDFGKGRLLLNDVERAKLPAGTKEVGVEFNAGKLSVTADGTSVLVVNVQ